MTRALVGPGYAGGPSCVVGARVGAGVGRVVGGDVGDGEAAAGAEDPMDVGEHGGFVGGEPTYQLRVSGVSAEALRLCASTW
jgi:hypothetical protein